MPKLPPPPSAEHLRDVVRLRTRDLVAVTTETVLWRVHRTRGEHVVPWNALRHYGPVASCRFDPQPPPPRPDQADGVTYLAISAQTALAEAFQTRRLVDRHLGGPSLVGLRLTRPVRLLDLSRVWPTRAGASQAISSGRRDLAQAWARRLREAFPELEGLWYPSSMDGGGWCVALWTPAADALPDAPVLSRPLADPALADRLAGTAARLGYRLL
ncbi:MAG TPA: RES family NAD+ phosphorylase [Mycobacteriales bacterium]|nr:RES family NAD+ phosphorylase [Mycobacteriales bacterium]